MPVPASIHPAIVSRFVQADPFTRAPIADPEIDGLVAAVGALQETGKTIDGLAASISADRSRTPGENSLRLKSAATVAASKAAAQLDTAIAQAQAEIARLAAATSGPASAANLVEESRRAELRAALRTAKDPAAEVMKRLAAGDGDELVAAALGADQIVTGIEPARLAAIRHAWQRKHFPKEVERLDRLGKALAATERTGKIFAGYLNATINSPAVKLADTNAQRAAEAVAAAQQ